MKFDSGILVGICRPVPNCLSFVTPVFETSNGVPVVQIVAGGWIVGFEEVDLGEEFVPLRSTKRVSIGDCAIYGKEFEGCISIGPLLTPGNFRQEVQGPENVFDLSCMKPPHEMSRHERMNRFVVIFRRKRDSLSWGGRHFEEVFVESDTEEALLEPSVHQNVSQTNWETIPKSSEATWTHARSLFGTHASHRGVVLRDNWGAVMTGNIDGNGVVVDGERYPFSLSLPKECEPVPDDIESLITGSSRIPLKLYGREWEFAELRRWCNAAATTSVRVLCGGGGAGKSRLALELAQHLCNDGWQVGHLEDPAQPVTFPIHEQGTLLVIDYAEQFSAALERLLRHIENRELRGVRLRLLLLSRHREVTQALIDRNVEPLCSPAMELGPLPSDAVAWAFFQDACQQMAKLRGASTDLPLDHSGFDAWLKRDPAHGQPLTLLCFALNLLDDPNETQLGRVQILQRLVQRERERIAKEVNPHGLQVEGVELLKALAAIPGRLTASGIDALAMQSARPDIRLPATVELQRTTLWRQGALGKMQPDLLASMLIHTVIMDRFPNPSAAGPWIWSALTIDNPTEEELRRRLRRIARLSTDQPRPATQEPSENFIIAALASLVSQDEDKAKLIDKALNRDFTSEWVLQPLALSASRKVATIYKALAQRDLAAYASDRRVDTKTRQPIDGSNDDYDEDDRTKLIDQIKEQVRVLYSLKGRVRTAAAMGVSESFVARLRCMENPPIGRQRLADLLALLPRLIEGARLELFFRSTVRPVYVVLDRCTTSPAPDDQVIEAIEQNVWTIFTGSSEERCSLPPPEHGVLVQVGPPEFGLYFVQVEGATALERLKVLRHEIDHLITRLSGNTSGEKYDAAF